MRTRAALAAVLAAAAALAAPAHAASAAKVTKTCNIIKDDKGDSTANNIPGDASVDITGGDFASSAKAITAVIKIDNLQNPDPNAPLGQSYFMIFTVKGVPDELTLSAGIYPTGIEYKYGYQGVDPTSGINTSYTLGDARGTWDAHGVTVSVDIAKYPQAKGLKKGAKVSSLTAEARRVYGQRVVPSQQAGPVRAPLGGVTFTFDDATASNKYALGQPSCVKIG